MTQLVADRGDSAAAYERWLGDPASGLPALLVTTDSEAGDYEPHVTQAYAETAARRLGFQLEHTMALPDGRLLRVWVQLP
jgi:hypothetical protein